MATEETKAIQAAIDKKGYEWKAERTSVSELSANEQKAMLGLKVDEDEIKATKKLIDAANELRAVQRYLATISVPPMIDWRENGGNWTTSIKDQGRCGSCVAFGTSAALEARIKIKCKNANMNPDLSEAHLFIADAAHAAVKDGILHQRWTFAKIMGLQRKRISPTLTPIKPARLD